MIGAFAGGLLRLGLPKAGPLAREFVFEFFSPRFFYEFFAKDALETWQGPPPEVGWLYVAGGLIYLAVLVYFFRRYRFFQQLRQGWVRNRLHRKVARQARAERRRMLKAAEEELAGVSFEAFHALAEGNRAFDGGRYEEALAAYEEASASTPPLSAALVGRGAALGRLGRHTEARDAFRRALEVDPANAEALVNLGLTALASKDVQGAGESFRLALEADGATAQGHYGLAVLAAYAGDKADVLTHLKRALRLKPSLAEEACREPAFTSLEGDGCLRALLERYGPKVTRLRRTG